MADAVAGEGVHEDEGESESVREHGAAAPETGA